MGGDAASSVRATILVVEDEAPLRSLIERMLRRAGYDVRVAENGASALASFESGGVDLALIDFTLPSVDGGEVARTLRARRPELPVVLMSGTDRTADAATLGAAFLPKPFHSESLGDAVRCALGQRAAPAG